MKLTFAEAHALFDYDPITGALTWAEGGGKIRLGRKAGAMTNGRVQVRLPDGKTALANRIIWLWMTGQAAKGNLQHINEDCTDFRWDNMQACRAEHDPEHHLFKNGDQWFVTVFTGSAMTIGPFVSSKHAAMTFASVLKSFVGITV